MKQSVVILRPPYWSPALYKEWIVYFVPLRSPIGAIESSHGIHKVSQNQKMGWKAPHFFVGAVREPP
jgi:hypothetical protein